MARRFSSVGAVSPSGSIGFNVVQKKHSKKNSKKRANDNRRAGK